MNPDEQRQYSIGRGESQGGVAAAAGLCYGSGMTTLAEIEAAADTLRPEQKQELLLFLAARLRAEGATMPEPRKLTREQVAAWIAEDEADMKQFREGT